jgi:hypothetical protein
VSKSDCDRPISLPLPTRHERILSAIRCFDGWGYTPLKPDKKSREVPHFPWDIPGINGEIIAPKGTVSYTDCCAFVEAVIIRAYDVQEWGIARHRQSMLTDVKRPFSPVEVLEQAGLTQATENAGRVGAPRWYAVQGWRGGLADIPQCGGHTFLIEAMPGDAMITLHEANVSTGVHSLATTWRTIHRRYPSNKIVRLRDV